MADKGQGGRAVCEGGRCGVGGGLGEFEWIRLGIGRSVKEP